MTLTPLEADIIGRYHERYAAFGFPSLDELTVTSRDNDGGGRFTYFSHPGELAFSDGPVGLGVYSQFDMEGLPYGASFALWVFGGKIDHLDITPNGDVGWDGVEQPWTIIDPGELDASGFR